MDENAKVKALSESSLSRKAAIRGGVVMVKSFSSLSGNTSKLLQERFF